MTSSDREAIADLLNAYCYIVDDARWDALDEVFSSDVVFVNTHVDSRLTGLDAVADWYRCGRHPAAHLLSNVLIDVIDDGQARARSKYLTVQATGTTGTGEYRDELQRTPQGWRITSRTVFVKAAPPYPARST